MKTILIIVSMVVIIMAGVIGYLWPQERGIGSVERGSEYHATTTSASFPFDPEGLIREGSGALGSVIVSSAGIGNLNLYNATTTKADQRAAKYATSTILIASVPLATASSYIFDSVFYIGLVADFQASNNGTTTITWK